ncbi:hypothetical protein [uncultured Sulfitobacter sp.]|uniref:hypothetical protein n=1 Tax=uncultured Sulfitobacter sp. TaxID=191468 RepID=UPI00261AB77B|nr:hypothetical protein [uncultured Sulfitobacter sp.]
MPDRTNLSTNSAPRLPRNSSLVLDQKTQLILEELFYQLIDRNDFSRGNLRKIGRFRSMTSGQVPASTVSNTLGKIEVSGSTNTDTNRPSSVPMEAIPVTMPEAVSFTDTELGLERSPLSYSFDDGIALLSDALRKNARDTSRVAALMVKYFAPMIARNVSGDSSVSSEKVLDSAIALLAPVARNPELNEAVIKIVPALRQLLGSGLISEQQGSAFGPLEIGEIQSLTGLATLGSIAIRGMSRRQEYESWTVIYYHEVLRMIANMSLGETDRTNLDRVLESSANNLAAGIGRMKQNSANSVLYPEVWNKLSNDLIKTSTLLADTRSTKAPEDIDMIAGQFGIKTTDEDNVPFAAELWSNRLSGFHMVSVPDLEVHHLLLKALRYTVVGLLREPIGLSQNVSSAFFNAGVELIRIKDRAHEVTALRMIVNGIGILGALRSSQNFFEAMVVNDGVDCLVNLMGSTADRVGQPNAELPLREVGRLMTVAGAIADGFGASEPRSVDKIKRSIELLTENDIQPSEEQLGPDDLAETIRLLVNRVGQSQGVQIEIPIGSKVAEFAPFLREAYAVTLPAFADQLVDGGGTEAFDAKVKMSTYLTDFIRNMMSGTDDPYELIRISYDTPVRETGETIGTIGPLIAIGMQSEDVWQAECQKALGFDLQGRMEEVIISAFSKFLPSTSEVTQTAVSPPASNDGAGGLPTGTDPSIESLVRQNPEAAARIIAQLLQQPSELENGQPSED